MRKDIFLPALAVAGGGAGFFLRRWQLASAYLPETGLFVHGAPEIGRASCGERVWTWV